MYKSIFGKEILMSSNEVVRQNKFEVKPQTLDKTIREIVDSIDSGYKLQERSEEDTLSNTERLDFIDSIFLKPFYQREYRFTVEEESSLIESILLGIPIPPVFLTSNRYRGVQILDVVDGQHRLTAFYRFRKNEFKLTNLPLLKECEGKSFDMLDFEYQEQFVSHKIQIYVFREFPGTEFELEVFHRYNKGTKTLTPQEIRNAVYNSPFNDYVNEFVDSLKKQKNSYLKNAYNITNDRFLKKKVHEGIFTILWVLQYGIQKEFKNSTVYADEYMKQKFEFCKKEYENNNEIEIENQLSAIKNMFNDFNEWLRHWEKITRYPFSKEIYGVSSSSYRFQTSIAMILAAVYRKAYIKKELGTTDFDQISKMLYQELPESFLEDPNYNASSTNSIKIFEFVNNLHF